MRIIKNGEKSMKDRSGFSLLEILIAMLILSILSAIAVNKYTERSEEARVNAAKAECKAIADAERQCEIDTGWYVSLRTLDDNPGKGTFTDTNTLEQYNIEDELVPYAIQTDGGWYFYPINSKDWKGPYITYQKVDLTGSKTPPSNYGSPLDPWGRPYKLFTQSFLTNPVQRETDYPNLFDRMVIVSYGKDGLPGNNSTYPGEGDDVIYRF